MYRSQLIPYLTALFSGGNPSAADFAQLVQGLGSEADRPHISCASNGTFIPDNQIIVSTVAVPAVGGGVVGSGTGACCCIPAPGSSTSVAGSTKEEKVINVLCDYFRNGWQLDVQGTCAGTPCAHAYYFVLSMTSVTGGAGIYDIYSIQRYNPGFDKNGVSSEKCIRVLRLRYNRSTECVVETASRLVLTDATPVVQSNEIKAIKIVYSTPPKIEDGVLYIQLKLAPVGTPEVTVTSVSQETIALSWGAVANAEKYEVVLKDVGTVIPVSGVSYTFTGLQPNKQYVVGVRAVGDGVNFASSSWTYMVVSTKNSVILQTPAPVVVSTSAASGVTIRWDAVPEAGSYSYRVGCGCSCGELVTGVMGTSVVLSGLAAGQSYQFSVKAVGTEASILDSDWATVGFTTK